MVKIYGIGNTNTVFYSTKTLSFKSEYKTLDANSTKVSFNLPKINLKKGLKKLRDAIFGTAEETVTATKEAVQTATAEKVETETAVAAATKTATKTRQKSERYYPPYDAAYAQKLREKLELEEARKKYGKLLEQYKELCGNECDQKFFNGWNSWLIDTLRIRTAELTEEISYEQMVRNAIETMKRGADYYAPPNAKKVLDLNNIQEIVPCSENKYKEELKRMCAIFLNNSAAANNALIAFNQINQAYFQEAAKGIKEIFALQNDSTNRMLERIPKLGLIPKALRVNDQIKIINCVMSDYRDVSEKYVNNGISPFMVKYANQYAPIIAYIEEHSVKNFLHKKYTDKILNIIKCAKDARIEADYRLMNSYAANGLNVSNLCNKVKTQGIIDLARKTAVTFASFF